MANVYQHLAESKGNFISLIPSSPHLTNRSMRVMTTPSLLLTFSILALKSKDGASTLAGARTPWGCSPHLHLLSPFPTAGQRDYSRPQGTPSSRQAPQSPVGCLHEKESILESLSGPYMGQSDEDYVSHLNEQHNTLQALTSGIVLHHITKQLECNYRVTEFEQLAYAACGFQAH